MKGISELDKKIIYELGKNSRSSYKELARKINSKKTVVSYHFQNLIEKGIIWKFVPIFSLNRLGIYAYKIYFKFHGLGSKEKKFMIKELVDNPLINWVAGSVGTWDLLISIYARNIMEFAKTKNKIFKKYGTYIQDYSVSVLEDALVFNRDYLINSRVGYRKEFVFGGTTEIEKVDKKQKDIIHLIRNNGRYQIIQICKHLNLNARTITSKISDLKDRGILQGYTTFLNINKLGLKFFKLCIYFQDYAPEKYEQFLDFCRYHKNVIHIIKSIGNWELELEIESESVEHIYSIIEELKTEYPKIIKKIDVITITNEYKLDFFPGWY